MRLEQLIYFVEVAKSGSYVEASKALFVTQPSISYAMKQFEETLGVKLFERSRQGAKLTEIGRIILPKAQHILGIIEEIQQVARWEEDVLTGKLSIAITPSMSEFITETLLVFKEIYPLVEIEINEEGTNKIIQKTINNQIDIGFCSHMPDENYENLIFRRLFSGKMLACVGKDAKFTFSDPLPLEVIAKQPLVMLNKSYRNYFYLKRLLKNDQELNILFSSENTEIAKKVISSGIAIGFYPDFYIYNDESVRKGDIIPLNIEGNDEEIHFGWIRSKNRHFSRVAKEFIKLFTQQSQHKFGSIS